MDEALRRRLENVDSPVPDDMWSRIQAARKDKRIHPFGWYYFSASILLVGVVSLWLSLGSTQADQPATNQGEQPVLQEMQTAEQATSSQPTAEIADLSASSIHSSEPDQNDSYTTNTDIQLSETASSITRNSGSETKKGATDSQTASASHSRSKAGNQASRSSVSDRQAMKEQQGDRVSSKISNGTTDGQVASADLRQTASSHKQLSSDTRQKSEVVEVDYRFATTDKLFRDGTEGVQTEQTRSLPGMGKATKLKSSPTCYSFNSFLRGLSVDAYVAPEYASRQLVYKDPSMIGYAEQRKNDESYMFAYSAGFRVNAHFKGGLALRTGLIYTDIAEKLEYRDENAQITKVINVTLDTIYQNGNIVYVWDTLSVTEYGSYNKIGYNRYRFYDIPLMVGYEIDRGNWVIQLNTGILFNIAASQRGDFLDPDHQLVNFDSNNEQGYQAFRTQVGSSLLMSMGFNYALRPKLHLLLEPQLRVWMQPLNIQAYPIDQKYVNLGVAMGIRQYF